MSAVERGGTIEVGGRKLAWRSVGSGRPLVLVNGYAATAADWDPGLLAGLAQSFEVICPDNRGVGGSDAGDLDGQPLTIDAMAADLEALLDALAIECAPVVGWSMGGFVAQRLVVGAPQRVTALVLLATDPGGPAAAPADPRVWAQLVDDSGTPREQATRLLSLLFPSTLAVEIDRQFGELAAAARAALPAATLRAQEAAMDAWHASEQPGPPPDTPPVLIACGSEDVVIPPANADALAAHWPDSRVERFAGGGHAFMAQEPARLAELIAAFVPD
jgi:pimeloyl-ACP methyl ester carboxylesterase